MGMFSKVFGKRRASGVATGVASLRPDEPIEVEIGAAGEVINPDGSIEPRVAPKSKQELMADLQRNYQEVLELVRKVDSHLDDTRDRSARMIELAERLPDGMAALDDLRRQTEVIGHAINRVTELTAAAEGHSSSAVDELRSIALRFDDANQRSEALSGAVGEFRGIMTEVASSGVRLNELMGTIQREASSREERLIGLIEREQRWMVFALALCGASVAVAGVIALLIVIR